jgi:WD40 repeat protein
MIAAIAGVALGVWPGRGGAPRARPGHGLALPALLAYLTSGYGKAYGGRVFVRTGDGRRSPGTPASPGPARPNEPGAAPFAVGFGWSPDGARAWVLDARGVLHLVPGRGLITGPVSRPAFSPDGTFLAYCEGSEWPLQVRVVAVDAPDRAVGSAVPGCEPLWSDDGTYVAYRMQSASGYRDLDSAAPRFGVRNTRLGLDFGIEGRWPVAWAPGPGYRFTPLTSVTVDGGSIQVMDPRGGQRRTLVSEATLRALARGRLLAPISALAWSPDATLLAVAFSRTPTGAGLPGVAVVTPTTGAGVFVGNADPVMALSWSSQGNLLAELDAARGPSILLFLGPRLGPSVAGVRGASWSPDGRWILGYTVNSGWVAVDASDPETRYRLGWDSSQWAVARWCCPPVPVVTVEAGAVS